MGGNGGCGGNYGPGGSSSGLGDSTGLKASYEGSNTTVNCGHGGVNTVGQNQQIGGNGGSGIVIRKKVEKV